MLRLETRPPNIEGQGEVTIRDLVRNALRMRPDRIIVGEVRGAEALDMLQAMNTGHDGSLTTIHANSPRDALSRLETMVLMAGFDLPMRAIREQIASAIDLIVQLGRLVDGSRRVTRDHRGAADGGGRRHAAGPVRGPPVAVGRRAARADLPDRDPPALRRQAEGRRRDARTRAVRPDGGRAPARRERQGRQVSALFALLVGSLVFAAALLLLTTRRRFATQQLGWYSGPSPRTTGGSAFSAQRIAELWENTLREIGVSDRLRRSLGRAGVDRSPGAFVAFVLLIAVAVFVLTTMLVGAGWGLILGIVVPFAALAGLSSRAHKRARAFEEQLPEILDSLSASLRAGHGFDHALRSMAEEIGEPAGAEFRRVVADTNLGRPLDAALRDLGERVYSKDLIFVLDSITIQRQVGGSLAELFELVSETVREREQFRRKLRAITGMVRTSATVLTALPLIAAVGLSLVNHSYEAPLFTTSAGRILMLITISMMFVGGMILRKIGSVKP